MTILEEAQRSAEGAAAALALSTSPEEMRRYLITLYLDGAATTAGWIAGALEKRDIARYAAVLTDVLQAGQSNLAAIQAAKPNGRPQ